MRLDHVDLPALDTLTVFQTPDGMIMARLFETYTGLGGQNRVALVDVVGRVHHYDAADVACMT